MSKRNPDLPRPTEAELEILHVLWQNGTSTVREVHESLGDGSGYTTTLKLMQVMHAKGLVERDDSQRAHVYRPVMPKETTQRQFLSDIVNRVYEGSRASLVLQALGSGPKASKEEIAEIRQLLSKLESR
jgi:BlaI family penicillinase repressor